MLVVLSKQKALSFLPPVVPSLLNTSVAFPGDKRALDFLSQCRHILLLVIYKLPSEYAYQEDRSLGNYCKSHQASLMH